MPSAPATDMGEATPLGPAVVDGDIGALKQRSVYGSAATFVSQGGRLLIKLAAQIFIARLLAPGDYGLIAMVAPILSLTYLFGELGLGQAVILQRDITAAEISSLFWFCLLLNLALAGGLALLSPAIALLYHEPRTAAVTLASAALLPIAGLAGQPTALLSRNMQFTALAILDIAPPAAGLAAGLTAAHSGWGYWSLVAFAAAETLAGVIVSWSLAGWRPGRPAYDPRIRRLIRIGGHLTGYSLAGYAANSSVNILLGVFQGSAPLGLYDRGYKLVSQPVTQLTAPVGRVAVPLLTRLRHDPHRYQRAYLDMLRLMILLSTPGMLFAMIMASPLVLFLLGPRWDGVAPVLAWLCLGGLAIPLYSSTFWLFTTHERTGQQVAYVAATSLISVASYIAGLPWGPAGVAAGAGMSFLLISTPLICWGATREGAVRFADMAAAMLPFMAAAMATAAVLELALRHLAAPGLAALTGLLLLAYATFVGALLCLPCGQPVVRRAWDLGMVLAHGARAAR